MPRHRRLNIPCSIHHVITRGLNRQDIFLDDCDRNDFLDGYLYQNRYKSILCQEDRYLLELLRYIHLNPVRAGMVKSLGELDLYWWSGHSVLVGRRRRTWQDRGEILSRFGLRKR